MEMTGDVLIGASRSRVWAGLNDPQVLLECIPGCESVDATSPTERSVRVAVKVGPVRARFAGHIRLEDVRDGEGCLIRFEGSGGAAGMAKGHSQVDLSDEAGGTRLRYTAQASVGGKLGQVGGRMIDAAAKQMADQFFSALNQRLAGPAQAEGAPPTADAPAQGAAAAPDPVAASAPATLPSMSHQGASPARAAAAAPASATEGLRILWFVLGSLSTGFGVWIASRLTS